MGNVNVSRSVILSDFFYVFEFVNFYTERVTGCIACIISESDVSLVSSHLDVNFFLCTCTVWHKATFSILVPEFSFLSLVICVYTHEVCYTLCTERSCGANNLKDVSVRPSFLFVRVFVFSQSTEHNFTKPWTHFVVVLETLPRWQSVTYVCASSIYKKITLQPQTENRFLL